MAKEGYAVLTALDGKGAPRNVWSRATLDLMLLEVDGPDVARTIRKTSNVAIVLSAKDMWIDKVIGLETE